MISARGLSRSFNGITAVQDLTFDVPEGKLCTLLGPNGAGKTTTIRMLLGLIAPTAGTARVAGHVLGAGNRAIRTACGLLTETPGFYERLPAWDNLMFFGRLYGISETDLPSRLERYFHMMGLWDRRSAPVGTYSKGMKQKLAIVRALFHDPRVVFLDEPTSGLDPEAALGVRDLIHTLKSEGRTIMVCTHNLDEAQRLADLVGVIHRRLLAFDTLENLRTGGGEATDVDIELVEVADSLREAVARLPFVEGVDVAPPVLRVRVTDARAQVPQVVSALVAAGGAVLQVRPRAHSLEEIYLRCVREGGNA
jgi:ABC-2 type transport system ATP-binding protein